MQFSLPFNMQEIGALPAAAAAAADREYTAAFSSVGDLLLPQGQVYCNIGVCAI